VDAETAAKVGSLAFKQIVGVAAEENMDVFFQIGQRGHGDLEGTHVRGDHDHAPAGGAGLMVKFAAFDCFNAGEQLFLCRAAALADIAAKQVKTVKHFSRQAIALSGQGRWAEHQAGVGARSLSD